LAPKDNNDWVSNSERRDAPRTRVQEIVTLAADLQVLFFGAQGERGPRPPGSARARSAWGYEMGRVAGND
jgi:hypothetical protein